MSTDGTRYSLSRQQYERCREDTARLKQRALAGGLSPEVLGLGGCLAVLVRQIEQNPKVYI